MIRRDFRPETYTRRAGVDCGMVGSVFLEERTWAALEEAAWTDRTTKQLILEELAVAYLRDRFPGRTLPTREEIRYGEVEPATDDELEPGEDEELPEGVRLLTHDEQGWRSGMRVAR